MSLTSLITGKVGSPIVYVGTWDSRPTISSVTPFIDRIFITNIGVGGSEWYSDGTRWRAVGGQVILCSGVSANNVDSTSTSDTRMEYTQIPAGLLQVGNRLDVDYYVTKTVSNADSTYLRLRIGTLNNSSDLNITSSSGSVFYNLANTQGKHRKVTAVSIKSTTTISLDDVTNSATGQEGTIALASDLTLVSGSLNSVLYLGVYNQFVTIPTASNTVRCKNLTVTLKTCG